MRTNLSLPRTAAMARLTNCTRLRPSDALTASAVAALLAATLISSPRAAHAADAVNVSQTGCHHVDEVKSTMFPDQDIVAYDFKGADASKLKGVMDVVTKKPMPEATLVRLVLVPKTGDAFAFQFGADGCATATLMGLDFAHMATVFDNAGVHAPFGSTYYQMTGQAI